MNNQNFIKTPIIVIGMGELGSLFSNGFLRLGIPIIPILRSDNIKDFETITPILVLIAVDIQDLNKVLDDVPKSWWNVIVLLQNELLPGNWNHLSIPFPSIVVVWLEKKKQSLKIRSFSPEIVYSPNKDLGDLIELCLNKQNIPTLRVAMEDEILIEMVQKNLFNLTMNVMGLYLGENSTFNDLLNDKNYEIRNLVARECLSLQKAQLKDLKLSENEMITKMWNYMSLVPEMKCQGRYAKARLDRAISTSKKYGIEVTQLEKIKIENQSN